jgi:ribosomal-protein-alanine N-acetyltransferase
MILKTKRLCLRPLEIEDLDALAKMYADVEIMRFIGSGKTISRANTEASIARWNEYELKHGFSNWAIIRNEDNAFTGKCGFSYLPESTEIEISYMLDEPYWGNGYASEIAGAALEYGFEKLGLKRIVALVYPQNSPSIKVLEKIGMKYEKAAEYWGVMLLMYSKEK